jgi:hypothetical protein
MTMAQVLAGAARYTAVAAMARPGYGSGLASKIVREKVL